MARHTRSIRTVAPPSARSLVLANMVEIFDADGARFIGQITQELSLQGGSMLLLHNGEQYYGPVRFAEDFDHIRITGFPTTYSIDEVTLIEIVDDENP